MLPLQFSHSHNLSTSKQIKSPKKVPDLLLLQVSPSPAHTLSTSHLMRSQKNLSLSLGPVGDQAQLSPLLLFLHLRPPTLPLKPLQPSSPRSHLNGFPASLSQPPPSPSTFYHFLSAPPHCQPLHLPHPFCTSLPQLLIRTPPTSHLHLNQSPLLASPPPEQPMYLGEDPQLQAYTTQVNLLFHHLQIFLVASCNHRPCLCKVGGLQRPNHLRICSSAKNSEY